MNKKQKHHESIIPGHGIGARVVNRDINFALRTWKRKLKTSDILDTLKGKREYIKPSITKRQEKIKASYIQKLRSLDEQY
jgi:small subunit ribosomal protein S21